MGDRYELLAPRDLVITMRSLGRRFDELIGPVRSDPDRFSRRDEPIDGVALSAQLAGVARHLGLLERSIGRLANESEPIIDGAVLADAPPLADREREMGLDAAEAAIAASGDAIGLLLDSCSSEQWTHRAPATNASMISLIEVARHAARIGVEGLRATQRIVERL